MNSTLSIIIPVYNIINFLNGCLYSIISQTYSDLEIILVDDGSTDGSDVLCNEWSKKDSRIKCIHQKNSGASAARNAGFEQSTGEYILFIDGDDTIAPGMCEKMLSKLLEDDADICYCGYVFITSKGNENRIPNNSDVFNSNQMLCFLLWNMPFYCIVWNKLFRRDVLLDSRGNFIPFPEGIHVGEDQLWLTRVLKNANKATPVPEALYYWNRRGDSATNGSGGVSLTDRYLTILDADIATIREMPSQEAKSTAYKKYLNDIKEFLVQAYYEKNKEIQSDMLKRYSNFRKMYTKLNVFSIKLDIIVLLVRLGAPYSFIRVIKNLRPFWKK